MNTNVIEGSWHAAKRRIAGFWSKSHSTPSVIDAPSDVTAETLEVHKLLQPASPFALMTSRVIAAAKPGMSKNEVKQQKEALSTWEDEGGTAAVNKPKAEDTKR